MDIVSSFTARLNELMKETGLTPKQISESTGIDLTELMHWKSDKNKKLPSTRNLLKLANFSDVLLRICWAWKMKTACQTRDGNCPFFRKAVQNSRKKAIEGFCTETHG